MAGFSIKEIQQSSINNGQKYNNGDGLQPEALNEIVGGVLYNNSEIKKIKETLSNQGGTGGAGQAVKLYVHIARCAVELDELGEVYFKILYINKNRDSSIDSLFQTSIHELLVDEETPEFIPVRLVPNSDGEFYAIIYFDASAANSMAGGIANFSIIDDYAEELI
jgi:hypothetical protein